MGGAGSATPAAVYRNAGEDREVYSGMVDWRRSGSRFVWIKQNQEGGANPGQFWVYPHDRLTKPYGPFKTQPKLTVRANQLFYLADDAIYHEDTKLISAGGSLLELYFETYMGACARVSPDGKHTLTHFPWTKIERGEGDANTIFLDGKVWMHTGHGESFGPLGFLSDGGVGVVITAGPGFAQSDMLHLASVDAPGEGEKLSAPQGEHIVAFAAHSQLGPVMFATEVQRNRRQLYRATLDGSWNVRLVRGSGPRGQQVQEIVPMGRDRFVYVACHNGDSVVHIVKPNGRPSALDSHVPKLERLAASEDGAHWAAVGTWPNRDDEQRVVLDRVPGPPHKEVLAMQFVGDELRWVARNRPAKRQEHGTVCGYAVKLQDRR
jgi:hypothetical protein